MQPSIFRCHCEERSDAAIRAPVLRPHPLVLLPRPREAKDLIRSPRRDGGAIMVAAGAEWLYELEEWKPIYDEETRKRLYLEQKQSGTVKKAQKIYPNDPCPCGSGKKYKKCHGRNGANRFETSNG